AIEGLAPGSYAAVTVHDTGCGMSPEVLRRAIEPFFTTKETGRGTGLGLSQVYGFVNQSGGHMSIDSAVGRGTTVRLLLPAARTTALREPRKQRAGIVLVVEDDPDVLQSTVEMVRGLGYDVLTADFAFIGKPYRWPDLAEKLRGGRVN